MIIHYPIQIEKIFNKLKKYTVTPIIVGGFVRDSFLGLESKDIDIELYNIDSLSKVEKILKEFGQVNNVGKSFGIVKLLYEDLDLDFSLPRVDNKIAKGHKGFDIRIDTTLTFKEASRRRDFTINTIGYDVFEKKILDPYNGKEDLEKKVLRAVDLEKFVEDPLRVLRAVSFSGRFSMSMEPKLLKLCKKMFKNKIIHQLPKERIFEEFKKLLLKSQKPSCSLYLLKEMAGFELFEEFTVLNDKEFQELLDALNRAVITTKSKNQKEKLIIMLAVLCSKFSQEQCYSFLNKLTDQKEIIQKVIQLTQTKFFLSKPTNYSLYKLANRLQIALYIPYLLALYENRSDGIQNIESKAKELGVFNKALQALIEGKDLINFGLKPSKEFSYILQDLYEKQMQGKFKTKEEAKKFLRLP